MLFHPASLVNTLIFTSLMMLPIFFLLRRNRAIQKTGIPSLLFCVSLIMFRLFFPFELTPAVELYCRNLYGVVYPLLYSPLLTAGGFEIGACHLLFLAWMAGAVTNLVKCRRGYLRFVRIVWESSGPAAFALPALQQVLSAYRKPVYFRVIQSCAVSTPLLIGLCRPVIVLPQMQLSNEELFYILKHEVSHHYRRDLWTKTLLEVLCAVYWWFPFIRLLREQATDLLEMRADKNVTEKIGEKQKINYLSCILKVAKGQQEQFALSFASGKRVSIFRRFEMVLEKNRPEPRRRNAFLLLLPVVLLFLASFLFVIQPDSPIVPPDPNDEVYTVAPEYACLLLNNAGGYDLYLLGTYKGSMSHIPDSYPELPIYQNIKEIPQYET